MKFSILIAVFSIIAALPTGIKKTKPVDIPAPKSQKQQGTMSQADWSGTKAKGPPKSTKQKETKNNGERGNRFDRVLANPLTKF